MLFYHAWCRLSCFSCVWLYETLWTIAHQAPLSVGFSRHGYWSGLPCYPSGDLLNLGLELTSLTSLALAGRFFATRVNSVTSSGYTASSGSLAVSTTSKATSSTEVLKSSMSFMKVGISYFQTPVNVNLLMSSHESQMFLMAFRVINTSQKIFNLACPDPSEDLRICHYLWQPYKK